jgi:parallel beta helix pectate lyase-like protein
MSIHPRGHRPVMAVLSLAVVACFSPLDLSAGTTVVVGTCKNLVQFATIQAAVNASPSGTIIDVCPGTYSEQVKIAKSLTLIGVESGTSDAAVVVPPSAGLVQNGSDIFGNPVAAQIFVAAATGRVTISNLTVDGNGNNLAGCGAPELEGIYFQNTSGEINNNVVRNQYQTDYADFGGCQNGFAINVESLTGAHTVSVSNNSVRSYQKNGITATGAATGADSPGPSVSISGNRIVGLAATALNWQGVYLGDGTAAENGVQLGFGASGSITANIVNDNIWGQDTSTDTGDAASGILVYASKGITVENNSVSSAQFGIVAVTDPTYGPADGTTIKTNNVAGTQLFDAIDLCSNSNVAQSNVIYGSTESGVHEDDSCGGTGNNNTVTGNNIHEACAGILLGTGTGNTSSPNEFFDVTNTTLAGDVCPAAVAAATAGESSLKRPALRPSPYKPSRK